jgi:hypothetical protein
LRPSLSNNVGPNLNNPLIAMHFQRTDQPSVIGKSGPACPQSLQSRRRARTSGTGLKVATGDVLAFLRRGFAPARPRSCRRRLQRGRGQHRRQHP